MRVMQQVLAPGVQDGDETDLGTQVLRVGGDGAQGLGGGMEQDVVDHRSGTRLPRSPAAR
jgi:hypothetical protein